jgi:signal transduction histidine kinase
LNDEKLGVRFENLKPGETIVYESILRDRAQRETPIQVYARIAKVEGMAVIQWIFRDISERKKLDRLREDLSAMIYHDLRSPLANVVSSLDVLDALFSQEEYGSIKSLVNVAVRSTERIQRLTESLLDISRLEAGQSIINPVAVMPHTLLKDSLEVVTPTAESKDLDIVLEVPSVLPPILVDADMIRRVIVNLTENAIKFTPAEGKIYVGAHHNGQYVQMWIRDTGPGISKIDQERIFDKFTRLNPRGSIRGVGLGLAYCRLAVVGHGGQIWVDSEPGSGSVFRFTLPIAEDT